MNDDHSASNGHPVDEPADAAEKLLEELLEQYDKASADGQTPRAFDDTRLPDALRDELTSLGQCVALLNAAARQGGLTIFDRDIVVSLGEAANVDGADGSLVGELIGRFSILRELGRGGYGVVFLARDLLIGREVALKLPRPEALVIPELRQRFLREAKAAGRLDHPHVLPLHEVVEDGALCYLVSPYCRGPSLARWLNERQGDVAVRDAAQLVAALAEGLDHAHRLGVLHRDIKPANVLLDVSATEQATGETGQIAGELSTFVPKLADFGLAKLVETTDNETRTGALLGTPAYMAPEQAEGRSDRIGPATDIYALGAILYELLTGRPPFVGRTDAETLRLLATVEPARPRPKAPRDLEVITLKCLEKSPTDRYPSAGELAVDLRRFLAGEPTQVRPAGPVRRLWKWVRRRPAVASFIVVTGMLLGMMAAGGWWYSQRLAFEEADLLARQYARDMRAAFEARENGSVDQADELLARYDDGTAGARLRNFEWYWLRGALHEEKLVIPTRHEQAYSVVFSPDAKLLLSGGQDGVIRAWDVQTGSLAYELRGHTSCVNQIAFSPDGNKLASASCDRTVRLWDFDARREIGTLGEHTAIVHSLAFARHNPWLATGSDHGLVQVWNTDDERLVARLEAGGQGNAIDALAFRGDDQLLATTAGARECATWETLTWTKSQSRPFSALSVAFAGHDPQLVVGTYAHEIMYWNVTRDHPEKLLGRLPGEVRSLAVSRRGQIIFAAGVDDGSIRAFALDRPVQRVFSQQARVSSLAVSPDDHLLASASFDGTVKIWELEPEHPNSLDAAGATEVSITRDYQRAIACFDNGAVRLWNNRTGDTEGDGSGVHGWRFSPRAKYAVGINAELRLLRLVNVPSLNPAAPSIDDIQPQSVSISGDDRIIAVLDTGGQVRIYDIASGQKRSAFALPTDEHHVMHLALSSDGSRLVWLKGGTISPAAIDTNTARHVPLPRDLTFLGSAFTYPGVGTFSPDGRKIVLPADDSGTFVIRDVIAGEDLERLRHASILTTRSAWSPDGERLVIATGDNSVVIYDPENGEQLGEMDGGLEPIISNLVFSSDGQTLTAFTGGVEGSPGRWCVWRGKQK